MRRSLSPDRLQLIADLANDEWIRRIDRAAELPRAQFLALCAEWDARLDEFLDTVRDPLELHLFADQWNWTADDYEPLERVAANPACERATALLLFWRGQAEDYVGWGPREDAAESEHQRRGYRFVETLQRRLLAGEFVVGDIWYDPHVDYRLAGPAVTATGPGWRIAPVMYDAVGVR